VVAILLATIATASGILATLDHAFTDVQTRWLQHDVANDIVIVEIDARSLKELGSWPLPRSSHARLLHALESAGATRIFLDIDFSAPSSKEEDAHLAAALAGLKSRAILPAFWQATSNGSAELILSEPIPPFKASSELALVNLIPGQDGLVREVADLSHLRASAPPAWQVLHTGYVQPKSLLLDYRIAPSSFARVSYADVLRKDVSALLRGKTAIVGATALELGDTVAVPVHRALPGIVVQAIALMTARSSAFSVLGTWATLLCVALWTVLCCWILWRGRWKRSTLAMASLISVAAIANAAVYAFADVSVPLSPFIVAAIASHIGSLLSSLNLVSWRSWRASRAARDRDALLRHVVDHSSDALLTLDSEHKVRTANRAAGELLGVPQAQLLGKPITTLASNIVDHFGTSGTFETWLLHASGKRIDVEMTVGMLEWSAQPLTTLALRDTTLQKHREAELRHLALHDALTGLPNRTFLSERLEQALQNRPANGLVALLMLDLDGFKEVNDALGHSMGDALMLELGQRLRQLTNPQRHVARVGGDEFAIVWSVESRHDIEEFAQQILLLVEEPIVIKGIPVSLGTSIGIGICPDHASDAEGLLQRADIALYVAKNKKTRVEFHDASSDPSSPRRLEMLTLLRAAVAKSELSLHFQPKIDMQSGAVLEVEALCRWESPVFGNVSPAEFIPLAEASDVIMPLTEWTIRHALIACREWRDAGIALKVAVNLSARHLQDSQLPHRVSTLIGETGASARWLELEITESAIMTDPDRAAKILHALRELGVVISIDDFGTGYSSLAYLRTLAVDRLKIDKSFIANMDKGEREQVIVQSTVKLAHGLGLQAVAEGIENQIQYSLLRKFGCDIGQGYFIAQPMPQRALIEWFRAHQSALVRGRRAEGERAVG
jgi:diguanylate cyclase (GGDEF)-like protein/PAS domain S-box-containing protein